MRLLLPCSLAFLFSVFGASAQYIETWPIPTNVTAFSTTTNQNQYLRDIWEMNKERSFSTQQWSNASTIAYIVGTNLTASNSFLVYTNVSSAPAVVRQYLLDNIIITFDSGYVGDYYRGGAGVWTRSLDVDAMDAWIADTNHPNELPMIRVYDDWATNYPPGIFYDPWNGAYSLSKASFREPQFDAGTQSDVRPMMNYILYSGYTLDGSTLIGTWLPKSKDVMQGTPVVSFINSDTGVVASGSIHITARYCSWPPDPSSWVLDRLPDGIDWSFPYVDGPYILTNETVTCVLSNSAALLRPYSAIESVSISSALPSNTLVTISYPTNSTRSQVLSKYRDVTRASFNYRYWGLKGMKNYIVPLRWAAETGSVYWASFTGTNMTTYLSTNEPAFSEALSNSLSAAWLDLTEVSNKVAASTSYWFGVDSPPSASWNVTYKLDMQTNVPPPYEVLTTVKWSGSRARLQYQGPDYTSNAIHSARAFLSMGSGTYDTISTNGRITHYAQMDMPATTTNLLTSETWIGDITPVSRNKFAVGQPYGYFEFQWIRP